MIGTARKKVSKTQVLKRKEKQNLSCSPQPHTQEPAFPSHPSAPQVAPPLGPVPTSSLQALLSRQVPILHPFSGLAQAIIQTSEGFLSLHWIRPRFHHSSLPKNSPPFFRNMNIPLADSHRVRRWYVPTTSGGWISYSFHEATGQSLQKKLFIHWICTLHQHVNWNQSSI